MTKSTIARERLEELASGQSGFNLRIATLEESQQLARMALAALDTEPVGEFYEDGPLNWYQISDGDRVPAHRRIPLYRHAQQPVVLNGFSVDRMEMLADRLTTRITSLEIHERTGNISSTQQETLDAFRIALEVLAVKRAQLPGSEPATVPGKWIPVSERMPDDNSDVLCTAEFDVPGDWRRKVGYWHEGKWVVYGASWTPTHWMPLPAGPKGVKGE